MISPLAPIRWSNVLLTPEYANRLGICILVLRSLQSRVPRGGSRGGRMELKLIYDLSHNTYEQAPVVNVLLQPSLTSEDELVDDCMQVLCCKGIFLDNPETIHVHP